MYNPNGLGLKSWKKCREVSPTDFNSYATASPARHEKEETNVVLHSVRVKVPKSLATAGPLSKVVPCVATDDNFSKSTAPKPDNVYEEVSRSARLGRRKIKEHVLPACH
jgi:hypothetical protein